jgi:hypothetical protein
MQQTSTRPVQYDPREYSISILFTLVYPRLSMEVLHLVLGTFNICRRRAGPFKILQLSCVDSCGSECTDQLPSQSRMLNSTRLLDPHGFSGWKAWAMVSLSLPLFGWDELRKGRPEHLLNSRGPARISSRGQEWTPDNIPDQIVESFGSIFREYPSIPFPLSRWPGSSHAGRWPAGLARPESRW